MRNTLLVVGFILMFIGCMLSYGCGSSKLQKAIETMEANEQAAAAWCDSKFPPLHSVEVRIDSAAYNETVKRLNEYKDSILSETEMRNSEIEGFNEYVSVLEKSGKLDARTIAELKAKLAVVKPVNVNVLRASIEAEIRSRIKPCEDSVIQLESGKRIANLNGQLSSAKIEIHDLKKENDELKRKLNNRTRIMWGLIGLFGLQIIIKLRKPIARIFGIPLS